MKFKPVGNDFQSLFHKIPKKKGKTIGNPPKVQQIPYNPKKENKN